MATDRVSVHFPQQKTLASPLRHYTGVWCVLVAALPVVVIEFGLIPVYESQKNLLSAYASFFCLLALAYVFSQRHRMARAMFAARLLWTDFDPPKSKVALPVSINGALAAMILGALVCTAIYLWAFEAGRTSPSFPRLPPSSMNAVLLALSFIALFVLASAACAVVAVREHMQVVLGLSDAEVITGMPRPAPAMSAPPSAARHGAIAVVPERGGTARVPAGNDEERFRSEDVFKSESSPAIRTTATDQGRF